MRRNPYPAYARLREAAPLLKVPPPFDGWMVLDYAGVRRVLTDHAAFSSRVPGPNWFIFQDPPLHTRQRNLISRAFTPRMIANLEPRIQGIASALLDSAMVRGEMDVVADFAMPLPMKVIAGILGIPDEDWERYTRWSDTILELSHARSGGEQAARALENYRAVTIEIGTYLEATIKARRSAPRDDLLTSLIEAEADGERLTHEEIAGFFQLLLVAGQETTSDLIANAVLCFGENPGQLARLRSSPELLPSAIEEVLRYRSPLNWMMRTPRADVELHGSKIPAGALVLSMIGSANRDPRVFAEPERFDIARDPNPHVAFGHGIHFCLGAALSRLESRVALGLFLRRIAEFELTGGTEWKPRKPLHVHGPASLPIRFEARARGEHRAA